MVADHQPRSLAQLSGSNPVAAIADAAAQARSARAGPAGFCAVDREAGTGRMVDRCSSWRRPDDRRWRGRPGSIRA